MSAIASAKALRRRAAGAPSMTWWSTVSERPILCSRTTVPFGAGRRARHDGVHAEDGHLGRVEHRREGLDAEGAEVRHREGAARELVGIDVARLAGRREPLGLGRYLAQREEVGVADHRHHEAARRVDREGEVDPLEGPQDPVLEGRVRVREARAGPGTPRRGRGRRS